MASIGISCAHVYVMKKRQEEKLKTMEAARESKQGSLVVVDGTERSMAGKSTNKKMGSADELRPEGGGGQRWIAPIGVVMAAIEVTTVCALLL
ncbi:hypothetical protein CRG98_038988 [Punica granatum]|uniref:Uncharacterized protein n=1 Tax=Punica granatum TaxID=22663 RepID=A0A2I0I9G1_PUNGR|nr:hypothetical protein CRG98_038988 [Punica granatum]